MNISDEAVEAAAYTVGEAVCGDLTPHEAAKQILEAAAPYLTERAYNAGHLDGMTGAPNTNPYRGQA